MKPAIDIQHLHKSYAITGKSDHGHDRLNVLNGINLQIRKGEVCGIIGHNGSGKSTLLKIISGITAPDKGQITLEGSIVSILELGTGFHPDLSGRENISFNAALMGFNKQFVTSVADDIIAFSELGDFIDAPVKTYSSGMYMRLAFAVAVFLKAEILLLDEVFSVGDQEFRHKCITMLNQLREEGTTILLVSHDFSQITSICNRCILLKDGKVAEDGSPQEVVNKYINDYFLRNVRYTGAQNNPNERIIWNQAGHPSVPYISIHSNTAFQYSRAEDIRLTFKVRKTTKAPLFLSFVLYYRFSELAMGAASFYHHATNHETGMLSSGAFESECIIPGGVLNTGNFIMELYLLDEQSAPVIQISNCCMLLITEDDQAHIQLRKNPPQSAVFVKLDWQQKRL